MRSRRRRAPLDHVLVAVDHTELDAARALLALVPEHAYGQLLVEVDGAAADHLLDVPRPPRVSVLPVRRETDDVPGRALGAAVAAWSAEWMPEEPDIDRDVAVWVGATVREGVDALVCRLERL